MRGSQHAREPGQRTQAFAYLFPVGFLIDVASTPLVTSNLTNIMAADFFRISFGRHMRLMAVPSLVLGLATMGLMWQVFQKDVPGELPLSRRSEPPLDRVMFTAAWAALAALAVGYVLSHTFGWPVLIVGLIAAWSASHG